VQAAKDKQLRLINQDETICDKSEDLKSMHTDFICENNKEGEDRYNKEYDTFMNVQKAFIVRYACKQIALIIYKN
jgi:hypothetical protein